MHALEAAEIILPDGPLGALLEAEALRMYRGEWWDTIPQPNGCNGMVHLRQLNPRPGYGSMLECNSVHGEIPWR